MNMTSESRFEQAAEMTEADPKSDAEPEEETAETEEDRLCKQLDAIKIQSKEINITVSGAANNHTHRKFPVGGPGHTIFSLDIPNKLFLLWSKRNKIENKLGVAETPPITLAAESMGNFVSLDASSTSLIRRLRNKQSRFLANYRRLGGAKQNKLQKQCTNMILLQEDVIPFTSTVNPQVYVATIYS